MLHLCSVPPTPGLTSTTRSHEAACVPPATSYRLLNPKWPTEGPKMADGVWVANKIGYARTHSLTHSPTPLLESQGGWVGCQLWFLYSFFIFSFLFFVSYFSYFIFHFFFIFCFSLFIFCFLFFIFHFWFSFSVFHYSSFCFSFLFFVLCFSFLVFRFS